MTVKKEKGKKSAQTLDRKPGRELALRAEGFFCLDLLLLFYQEKIAEQSFTPIKNKRYVNNSSPRGNERTEHFIKTRISLC